MFYQSRYVKAECYCLHISANNLDEMIFRLNKNYIFMVIEHMFYNEDITPIFCNSDSTMVTSIFCCKTIGAEPNFSKL